MFTTWASKMVFPSRIPVNISTHSSSRRSSPVASCSPSEHQESSSALRLILRETPEYQSAAARRVSVCVFLALRVRNPRCCFGFPDCGNRSQLSKHRARGRAWRAHRGAGNVLTISAVASLPHQSSFNLSVT